MEGWVAEAGWRWARRKGEGESLAKVRAGKERVGWLPVEEEVGSVGLMVIFYGG